MTQMLSLLAAGEVAQLRQFLERCVEGLERVAPKPAKRPRAKKKAAARRPRTSRRAT
jgi:hypothetical protein